MMISHFPATLTSQSVFPVVSNTTYFISVDGNEGDSGNVILNWRVTGSFSAGQFGFAAGRNRRRTPALCRKSQ